MSNLHQQIREEHKRGAAAQAAAIAIQAAAERFIDAEILEGWVGRLATFLVAMGQVLVLNASYEPLNVTSVRRAHVLVFKGKAEVLEELAQGLHSATDTTRGRT